LSLSEINIVVNGDTHRCLENQSVPSVLQSLGFNIRLIALEYNGEILHRQYWDHTIIREGDRLEVVTIVGGG